MSAPTTLYRFRIDLSDVDRGVYEQLDLRVARHPSEINTYMITRVLAFALNAREHLAFSPQGLGDPETAALSAVDYGGRILLWIEIGTPSARKLHKAAKVSDQVRVYTYKDPLLVLRDIKNEETHRGHEIEVTGFGASFLEALGRDLGKDNRWAVLVNDGQLSVTVGAHTFEAELRAHTLADLKLAP